MATLVDIPIGHPTMPTPADFGHTPISPQAKSTHVPETTASENLTGEDANHRMQNEPVPTSTGNIVEDPFILDSQFAYTPRKMKVITIGAGFSGLLMAHKFQHRFPEMKDIVEHKIFDMRDDVGGTWLANHYPGVQCDVPAHIYVRITPRRSISYLLVSLGSKWIPITMDFRQNLFFFLPAIYHHWC